MTGKAHELINESRDRYEVVRKLGEGAVGEVSLAKDNDIQRLVAIKRLKEPTPQTGSLVRFVEEIQTNGQLEHPNIAPVHDVGIDADGRYFFVMKYVRGDNLEEIIEKLRNGDAEAHRVYTPHYRTQIALEILRAVQFAHEQGVIHRDLKPSNVIVGPHGEVMVMDWGIAKTVRAQQPTSPLALPTQPVLFTGDILQKEERVFETSVGTLMGTPAYMSPEQALGLNDRIDQRSDIYSLCAMLYEFFSLQHYMGHKTDLKSMLMGIITEEPLRMDLVRNAHQSPPSRILSALLHKGLAKEPAQRYASVQELSDAIQHDYLEGQNAVACSYSLTRRSGNELLRYLDRHPRLAPLLAMSVMLFALFGGAVAIFFLVRLL
jgi:serine/threonine-protein kinase